MQWLWNLLNAIGLGRFLPKTTKRIDQYQVGDSIKILDSVHTVVKRWKYNEDGFRWVDYELEDARASSDNIASLEVIREDGEWVITLYNLQIDPNEIDKIDKNNWQDQIQVHGDTYDLHEKGRFTVQLDGDPSAQVFAGSYVDYRRGTRKLSIEVYDYKDEIEVWIGVSVNHSSVNLVS